MNLGQSLTEWAKDKPLSILQLDPADRAVLKIADERDAIQKKTFTKWMNKHLKKSNRHVGDLFSDLRDGHNLISLLEVLSGELLSRERGRMRFHMLQNVQTALDFLKSRKIKLVNIRPEDIVDGNPKLTLGLIWTIILHFQISDIITGRTDESVSARDVLLRWAQRTTDCYHNVKITDFTSSWRDGLAFNAIIHRNRPELLDFRSLRGRPARENLELAFSIAEREFGVTRLLDPEDVDTPEPDEKSLITYISLLYDVFSEPPCPPSAEGDQLRKVGEYKEMANILYIWIQESIVMLQDHRFPNSLKETKALLAECTRFRSEEVPPKLRDKQRLGHLHREIQKLSKEVQSIEIEESLRFDNIEQCWNKMIVTHQERDQAIRAEITRQEKLQRLAEKVQRDIKRCQTKLNEVEKRIPEEEKKTQRLHPMDAKNICDQIEVELRTLEENMKSILKDVQTLHDGQNHQASELHSKTQELHEQWVRIRLIFQTQLLQPLSTRTFKVEERKVTKQRHVVSEQKLVETSKSLQILQDNVDSMNAKLNHLKEISYGSDLESIQSCLEQLRNEQKTLDQYKRKLEQCTSQKSQIKEDEYDVYCTLLTQMETVYSQLMATYNKKLIDLTSLLEFAQLVNSELKWMSEKEKTEVSRDWSAKNLNIVAIEQHQEALTTELEKRETQFNKVQRKGEALLAQNHPASKCVETFLSTLQTQWSWLLQLLVCLENHLKYVSAYHQFFNEAHECEQWLKRAEHKLNTTYSKQTFSIDEGERLLKEMQQLRIDLQHYGDIITSLTSRSPTIVPLKQRHQSISHPITVIAVCSYKQQNIILTQNERCQLLDNSRRAKWKVVTSTGAEGMVPSICFVIPAPNQEAISLAESLQKQYISVVNLGTVKQQRLRQYLIFATIKVVKSWTITQFRSMEVSQRESILRALNDDAQKLLSEGPQDDPNLKRLQEEMKSCNKLIEELQQKVQTEENMETEKLPKKGAKKLPELQAALQTSLLEREKQLRNKLQAPIPSNLDSLENLVIEHKEFETSLRELESQVFEMKQAFLSLTRKTPVLQAKYDSIVQMWENIWTMSVHYIERLKVIETILHGIEEASQSISASELQLASHDDMPAEVDALQKVHSQILSVQNNTQSCRHVIDKLNEDINKLKQLTLRTHGSQVANFSSDISKFENDIQKITERWKNASAQVVERMRSCEASSGLLTTYRNQMDNENVWITETKIKVNSLKNINSLSPKEAEKELDSALHLYKSLANKKPSIENTNVVGGRFIREAKIYDLRLKHYKDSLEEVHPSLDASLSKRKKLVSGASFISDELDSLNQQYKDMVDAVVQYVNGLKSVLSSSGSKISVTVIQEFPISLKTFHNILQQTISQETTDVVTSSSIEIPITDIRTTEHDATIDTQYAEVPSTEESPLIQKLTTSSVVVKEFKSVKSNERLDGTVVGSKGIFNPKSGRKLTINEAIREGVINVERQQFIDTRTGKEMNLEEAMNRNYIDSQLGMQLLAPSGIINPQNQVELTLIEAISYHLYDPEEGRFLNPQDGNALTLDEAIALGIVQKDKISFLRDMKIIKLKDLTIAEAVKEGHLDPVSGVFTDPVSEKAFSLVDAFSKGLLHLPKPDENESCPSLSQYIDKGIVDDYSGQIIDEDSGEKLTIDEAIAQNLLRADVREVVNTDTEELITVSDAIALGILNIQNGRFINRKTGSTITFSEARSQNLIFSPMSLKQAHELNILDASGKIIDPFTNESLTVLQAIVKGLLNLEVKCIVLSQDGQLVTLLEALSKGILSPEGLYKDPSSGEMITLHECANRGLVTSVCRRSIFDIEGISDPSTQEQLSFNDAVTKGIIDINTGKYKKSPRKMITLEQASKEKLIQSQVYNMLNKEIGIKDEKNRQLTILSAVTKGILDPKTGKLREPRTRKPLLLKEAIDKGIITPEGASHLKALLNIVLTTAVVTKTVIRTVPASDYNDNSEFKITFQDAMTKGLINETEGTFTNPSTGEVISLEEAINRGLIRLSSEWPVTASSEMDIMESDTVIPSATYSEVKSVSKAIDSLHSVQHTPASLSDKEPGFKEHVVAGITKPIVSSDNTFTDEETPFTEDQTTVPTQPSVVKQKEPSPFKQHEKKSVSIRKPEKHKDRSPDAKVSQTEKKSYSNDTALSLKHGKELPSEKESPVAKKKKSTYPKDSYGKPVPSNKDLPATDKSKSPKRVERKSPSKETVSFVKEDEETMAVNSCAKEDRKQDQEVTDKAEMEKPVCHTIVQKTFPCQQLESEVEQTFEAKITSQVVSSEQMIITDTQETKDDRAKPSDEVPKPIQKKESKLPVSVKGKRKHAKDEKPTEHVDENSELVSAIEAEKSLISDIGDIDSSKNKDMSQLSYSNEDIPTTQSESEVTVVLQDETLQGGLTETDGSAQLIEVNAITTSSVRPRTLAFEKSASQIKSKTSPQSPTGKRSSPKGSSNMQQRTSPSKELPSEKNILKKEKASEIHDEQTPSKQKLPHEPSQKIRESDKHTNGTVHKEENISIITQTTKFLELPAEGWSLEESIAQKLFDDNSGLFTIPGTDRLVSFEETIKMGIINPKSATVIEPGSKRPITLLRSLEKGVLDSTGHYHDTKKKRVVTLSEAVKENLVIFEESEKLQEPKQRFTKVIEVSSNAENDTNMTFSNDVEQRDVVFRTSSIPKFKREEMVTTSTVEYIEVAPNIYFDQQSATVLNASTGENIPLSLAIKKKIVDLECFSVKDPTRDKAIGLNQAIKRGIVNVQTGKYIDLKTNKHISLENAVRSKLITVSGKTVPTKIISSSITGSPGPIHIVEQTSCISKEEELPDDGRETSIVMERKIVEKHSVCIKDPKSGELLTLEQAIEKGVITAEEAIPLQESIESLERTKQIHKKSEEMPPDSTSKDDKLVSSPSTLKIHKRVVSEPRFEVTLGKAITVESPDKEQVVLQKIRRRAIPPKIAVDEGLIDTTTLEILDNIESLRNEKGEPITLDEALKKNLVSGNEGSIIDPRKGESLSIKEAVNSGLLDSETSNMLVPIGRSLSLSEVVSQGLILPSKKRIIHPETGDLLSLQDAITCDIVNPVSLVYSPATQHPVTLEEAIRQEVVDNITGDIQIGDKKINMIEAAEKHKLFDKNSTTDNYILPMLALSFPAALRQGLINTDKKEYVHPVSGKQTSVPEAIEKGLIMSLPFAPTSDGIDIMEAMEKNLIDAKNCSVKLPSLNRDLPIVDAIESGLLLVPTSAHTPPHVITSTTTLCHAVVECQTIKTSPGYTMCGPDQVVNTETGEILTVQEAKDKGIVKVEIETRRMTSPLTFSEALEGGFVNLKDCTYTDILTGRTIPLSQAIVEGLIIPNEETEPSKSNKYTLNEILNFTYDERSGKYREPESNKLLSLEEMFKENLIDLDAVIYDTHTGIPMTTKEAIDNGNLDTKTCTILESESGNKIPLKQALKMGMIAVVGAPILAGAAVTSSIKSFLDNSKFSSELSYKKSFSVPKHTSQEVYRVSKDQSIEKTRIASKVPVQERQKSPEKHSKEKSLITQNGAAIKPSEKVAAKKRPDTHPKEKTQEKQGLSPTKEHPDTKPTESKKVSKSKDESIEKEVSVEVQKSRKELSPQRDISSQSPTRKTTVVKDIAYDVGERKEVSKLHTIEMKRYVQTDMHEDKMDDQKLEGKMSIRDTSKYSPTRKGEPKSPSPTQTREDSPKERSPQREYDDSVLSKKSTAKSSLPVRDTKEVPPADTTQIKKYTHTETVERKIEESKSEGARGGKDISHKSTLTKDQKRERPDSLPKQIIVKTKETTDRISPKTTSPTRRHEVVTEIHTTVTTDVEQSKRSPVESSKKITERQIREIHEGPTPLVPEEDFRRAVVETVRTESVRKDIPHPKQRTPSPPKQRTSPTKDLERRSESLPKDVGKVPSKSDEVVTEEYTTAVRTKSESRERIVISPKQEVKEIVKAEKPQKILPLDSTGKKQPDKNVVKQASDKIGQKSPEKSPDRSIPSSPIKTGKKTPSAEKPDVKHFKVSEIVKEDSSTETRTQTKHRTSPVRETKQERQSQDVQVSKVERPRSPVKSVSPTSPTRTHPKEVVIHSTKTTDETIETKPQKKSPEKAQSRITEFLPSQKPSVSDELSTITQSVVISQGPSTFSTSSTTKKSATTERSSVKEMIGLPKEGKESPDELADLKKQWQITPQKGEPSEITPMTGPSLSKKEFNVTRREVIVTETYTEYRKEYDISQLIGKCVPVNKLIEHNVINPAMCEFLIPRTNKKFKLQDALSKNVVSSETIVKVISDKEVSLAEVSESYPSNISFAINDKSYDAKLKCFLHPQTSEPITFAEFINVSGISSDSFRVKDFKKNELISLEDAIVAEIINKKTGEMYDYRRDEFISFSDAIQNNWIVFTAELGEKMNGDKVLQLETDPLASVCHDNKFSGITLMNEVICQDLISVYNHKSNNFVSPIKGSELGIVNLEERTYKNLMTNELVTFDSAFRRGFMVVSYQPVALDVAVVKNMYQISSGFIKEPLTARELSIEAAVEAHHIDGIVTKIADTKHEVTLTLHEAIDKGIIISPGYIVDTANDIKLSVIEAVKKGIVFSSREKLPLVNALKVGLYNAHKKRFFDPASGDYLTLKEAVEIGLLDIESIVVKNSENGDILSVHEAVVKKLMCAETGDLMKPHIPLLLAIQMNLLLPNPKSPLTSEITPLLSATRDSDTQKELMFYEEISSENNFMLPEKSSETKFKYKETQFEKDLTKEQQIFNVDDRNTNVLASTDASLSEIPLHSGEIDAVSKPCDSTGETTSKMSVMEQYSTLIEDSSFKQMVPQDVKNKDVEMTEESHDLLEDIVELESSLNDADKLPDAVPFVEEATNLQVHSVPLKVEEITPISDVSQTSILTGNTSYPDKEDNKDVVTSIHHGSTIDLLSNNVVEPFTKEKNELESGECSLDKFEIKEILIDKHVGEVDISATEVLIDDVLLETIDNKESPEMKDLCKNLEQSEKVEILGISGREIDVAATSTTQNKLISVEEDKEVQLEEQKDIKTLQGTVVTTEISTKEIFPEESIIVSSDVIEDKMKRLECQEVTKVFKEAIIVSTSTERKQVYPIMTMETKLTEECNLDDNQEKSTVTDLSAKENFVPLPVDSEEQAKKVMLLDKVSIVASPEEEDSAESPTAKHIDLFITKSPLEKTSEERVVTHELYKIKESNQSIEDVEILQHDKFESGKLLKFEAETVNELENIGDGSIVDKATGDEKIIAKDGSQFTNEVSADDELEKYPYHTLEGDGTSVKITLEESKTASLSNVPNNEENEIAISKSNKAEKDEKIALSKLDEGTETLYGEKPVKDEFHEKLNIPGKVPIDVTVSSGLDKAAICESDQQTEPGSHQEDAYLILNQHDKAVLETPHDKPKEAEFLNDLKAAKSGDDNYISKKETDVTQIESEDKQYEQDEPSAMADVPISLQKAIKSGWYDDKTGLFRQVATDNMITLNNAIKLCIINQQLPCCLHSARLLNLSEAISLGLINDHNGTFRDLEEKEIPLNVALEKDYIIDFEKPIDLISAVKFQMYNAESGKFIDPRDNSTMTLNAALNEGVIHTESVLVRNPNDGKLMTLMDAIQAHLINSESGMCTLSPGGEKWPLNIAIDAEIIIAFVKPLSII